MTDTDTEPLTAPALDPATVDLDKIAASVGSILTHHGHDVVIDLDHDQWTDVHAALTAALCDALFDGSVNGYEEFGPKADGMATQFLEVVGINYPCDDHL